MIEETLWKRSERHGGEAAFIAAAPSCGQARNAHPPTGFRPDPEKTSTGLHLELAMVKLRGYKPAWSSL
jgi:hypothetical protein